MKTNEKFILPSDYELIVNTCLTLLTMIRKCNNDNYCFFLRKAYLNLNALRELMKIDEQDSVLS